MTMFSRRSFLISTATTATALALPKWVEASETEYDPAPQEVRIRKQFEPGQLLVLPSSYYLYYVTEPRKAMRYGVGVGRAGLEFTGAAVIGAKREWPSWRPTDEMIERSPRTYAKFVGNRYIQPGGPSNPLGARALYLFQNGRDTYIRIHGTTQPETIGTAASNGCFRMVNDHVIDLYQRVPIGTPVTVL
jgi:lipoprotein-anchoring transpeptidase ErfK/SrfK